MSSSCLRQFHELAEVVAQDLHLVLGQVFGADEPVARPTDRRDQFVELQVDRQRVLVLRSLDQEHHQERDDGGAGVDDELPGVRVVEDRPSYRPDENDGEGQSERP